MSSAKLNHSEFPNGKIWMHYPQWTGKRTAYIVHMNWLTGGHKKKHRMVRDGLWFLDPDDRRCAAGFDPFRGGCQRLCAGVKTCLPGQPCIYLPVASCADLLKGKNPFHAAAIELCEQRKRAEAALEAAAITLSQ